MIQRRKEEDYNALPFPAKLAALLDDAERLGFDDIVSWQPEGKSFKVMQPARFAKDIMQSYFNQTKYKSFQRQLNMYGFRRVHLGPNMGGYVHRKFIRQSPELSNRIVRRPTSNQLADQVGAKQKCTSNFYKVKQKMDILESIDVDHEIKLEDSEVTAFYDFFYPQDRTEQAWVSSIFDGDIVTEKGNDFLNDISAMSGSFDIDDCQEEAQFMDDQSVSLVMSEEEYQQTAQPPAVVSDHEVEEEEEDESECEHSFPWKLHQMLEHAQIENLQHIVSWVKDGSAFQVHDSRLFVEKVMPNYFEQTKYDSFRRQLNSYGFARVSKGTDRGVISHPDFVGGARSKCRNIVRKVS